MADINMLKRKIKRLKEEKNAIILAHNYQRVEVQDVADYIGDSLELSRVAAKAKADVIVFCGVDFMAETACILNPGRIVLLPCRKATCPMAAQLPASLVRRAKGEMPDIPFIAYVNTLAEAKAEADICCTSANAPKVVSAVARHGAVMMGPDRNLAWHSERVSGIRVVPVPSNGYCYVHKKFRPEDVKRARRIYPDAVVLVHPECDPEVQELADFIGSTSQMVKFAHETDASCIVIGTEIGLVERLRRELPDKTIVPLREDAICREMKTITLEKVVDSLRNMRYVVKIPDEIAERAEKAIKRMLSL